MVNFFS
jgi:hypothetical protein